MILVDSNAWIYYLDAGLDEHARVREVLPAALADDDALIPSVVQMEVVHYISRQMGGDAGDVVDAFLAHPGHVAPLTGGVVAEASRLLLKHRDNGIGGRDASLLVMARRGRASLLTADRALATVAEKVGVDAVDPTE